jgi:hypothetical protein
MHGLIAICMSTCLYSLFLRTGHGLELDFYLVLAQKQGWFLFALRCIAYSTWREKEWSVVFRQFEGFLARHLSSWHENQSQDIQILSSICLASCSVWHGTNRGAPLGAECVIFPAARLSSAHGCRVRGRWASITCVWIADTSFNARSLRFLLYVLVVCMTVCSIPCFTNHVLLWQSKRAYRLVENCWCMIKQ